MSHVIIVAFEVYADDREKAERFLYDRLPLDREGPATDDAPYVDSWWVAEDDRRDRSDCDSAVFVRPGKQREARNLLLSHDLAY